MDRRGDRSVDDADGRQPQVMRPKYPPRRTRRTRRTICLSILSLTVTAMLASPGCSSPQKPQSPASNTGAGAPKTPDGCELRSVTLPDPSQMAPSAQKQIRDQYVVHANDRRSHDGHGAEQRLWRHGKAAHGGSVLRPRRSLPAQRAIARSERVSLVYYLAHLYRTRGDVVKSRSLFEARFNFVLTMYRRSCGWGMPILIRDCLMMPTPNFRRRCRSTGVRFRRGTGSVVRRLRRTITVARSRTSKKC